MRKIRKIFRAVSEKSTLPTNQSTNYYQQHRFYRTWLTPVQQKILGIIVECKLDSKSHINESCKKASQKLELYVDCQAT